MKLTISFACCFIMLAICVDGAPQAGPILGLPIDSYSPQCRPAPCPSSGNATVGFPLDCLQYVQCTNGVAQVRACPPDMFWHEASGACAGREVASCKQCW